MIKLHEKTHIRYVHKDGGETTERVIFPTFVPSTAMKAVDVTDLSENEQDALQDLLKNYATYFENATRRVFSFEDWISHTTGFATHQLPEVKWRTFLLENVDVIE